ncbi:MAG TPA: hypothetical protein VEZ89_15525 [Rubrivivax sp.]|nr:hypothetical protein [Rubrivivax sp.]
MPFTSTPTTGAQSTMTKVGHLAEDAAASVQDLTNRSIDRAREMSTDLRNRAYTAGNQTIGYVREQPVKTVLMAVAAGAAIAVLVRMLSGDRYDRYDR